MLFSHGVKLMKNELCIFLEREPMLTQETPKRMTPLFKANSVSVMETLLNHGADINAVALDGETVVFRHVEELDWLKFLSGRGADLTICDRTGKTLLHCAARADLDEPEIFALLCQHGCEINAKDKEGVTPLHVAAAQGSVKTIRVPLSRGADLTLRSNKGDSITLRCSKILSQAQYHTAVPTWLRGKRSRQQTNDFITRCSSAGFR